MKQVWPAASALQIQLPPHSNRWCPCRFHQLLLVSCKMGREKLRPVFAPSASITLHFSQQDSEKMKRLRDAIKAQTDYTIAVSISKLFNVFVYWTFWVMHFHTWTTALSVQQTWRSLADIFNLKSQCEAVSQTDQKVAAYGHEKVNNIFPPTNETVVYVYIKGPISC